MKGNDWSRVRQLFSQAREIDDPARRMAWLKEQCGGDAKLIGEVESLLAADAGSGEFLSAAPHAETMAVLDREHKIKMHHRKIGAWRILELVHQGGMGEIYLAERIMGGFQQRAALKLLRLGLATPELVQRFEQERQILAGLEHSAIARLLDGGRLDDGLPFLAMEYVDGEHIDAWCDRNRLDVYQRVALLRRVCDAVQHAHQHLIIHRDLKPANILVTAGGELKVIDFGIAKLLEQGDGDGQVTGTTTLLTRDYASPEQVRGELVSTQTDVYALGILAYWLLAGLAPYRIDSGSLQDLFEKVCEIDPLSPGKAFSRLAESEPERVRRIADLRSMRTRRLQKTLNGDLGIIVMKALRKDPARRYDSPAALAADLERWQKGLPVEARPDSMLYRIGRFARRHRVAAAAFAMVVLALIGGLGATLWQAGRATTAQKVAESRFEDVHQLANALVFDLHDAIVDLPGSTRARRLLVEKALIYLEELRGHAGSDHDLLDDLATAYTRIGDVQGHPEKASLGDLSGARDGYLKAVAIRRELLNENPVSVRAKRALANALDHVGMAYFWQDKIEDSLRCYEEALVLRHDVLEQERAGDSDQRGLAATLEGMARVLSWESRVETALQHFDRAVDIREQQHADRPDSVGHALELATALNLRGFTRVKQDMTAGVDDHRRAVEISARALDAARDNPQLQLVLVRSRTRLAQALRRFERWQESIGEHERALAVASKMVADDAHDVSAREMLAWTGQAFSETCDVAGRLDCAEEHAHAALEQHKQLALANPDDASLQQSLAIGHQTLGRVLSKRGHFDQARTVYADALALQDERLKASPDALSIYEATAGMHLDLGENEYDRARLGGLPASERVAALERALEHYEQYFDLYRHIERNASLSAYTLRMQAMVAERVEEVRTLVETP